MTTPIDPTDEPTNPYSVAYEAINEAALGIIDHGEAVHTIADAFIPNHHAVYDTRTHVAVPVGDLTEILNQHEFMVENHMTSPENETSYRTLRSLLPTESEDEECS